VTPLSRGEEGIRPGAVQQRRCRRLRRGAV